MDNFENMEELEPLSFSKALHIAEKLKKEKNTKKINELIREIRGIAYSTYINKAVDLINETPSADLPILFAAFASIFSVMPEDMQKKTHKHADTMCTGLEATIINLDALADELNKLQHEQEKEKEE